MSRRETQSDLCFKNNIKKLPAKPMNVGSKDGKGKPIRSLLEDSRWKIIMPWTRNTVTYGYGGRRSCGLGCILKVVPMGFVDGLDVESERKKAVRLSSGQMKTLLTLTGKYWRKSTFGGEIK